MCAIALLQAYVIITELLLCRLVLQVLLATYFTNSGVWLGGSLFYASEQLEAWLLVHWTCKKYVCVYEYVHRLQMLRCSAATSRGQMHGCMHV